MSRRRRQKIKEIEKKYQDINPDTIDNLHAPYDAIKLVLNKGELTVTFIYKEEKSTEYRTYIGNWPDEGCHLEIRDLTGFRPVQII